MDIREELCEHYGNDLLFADGYDDAIVGVCGGFDSGRVAYSIPKMIEIAAKDLSVDCDEAAEWLEYNTFGAYVGESTPIYIDDRFDVFAEDVGQVFGVRCHLAF